MTIKIAEKIDTLKTILKIPIGEDDELQTAFKNLEKEIVDFSFFKEERITELEKKVDDLEDENTTEYEIEFEKIDKMTYDLENGNLWVQQIMEDIEKIAKKKGVKYLMDRLAITVKAIDA